MIELVAVRRPLADMADTKQQFIALFSAYMKDGNSSKLFSFIDGQPLVGLRDCIAAYFDTDSGHQQRPRSRAVFVRLVVHGVGTELQFALFADVMTHTSSTSWRTHYQELSGGEKGSIDKAIERQTSRMPKIPHQFVDLFQRFMTPKSGISIDKVAAFLKPLKATDAQACLGLYIDISPWYEKGNDYGSLGVFFLASYQALQPGEAAYASAFAAKIDDDLTVWHTRFRSLTRDQQDALRGQIKQAGTVTPAAADPGGKPKALTEDQKLFVRLYRSYVDSKGERKAIDAFQRFLVGRSGDALAGYVQVYLDDSAPHYGEPPSRESSQVFFGTLSLAIARGSAYYAYKIRSFIDSPNTVWHRRYAALDRRQYGIPLRSQLDSAIKTKARFIDDLRIAYYLKHQRDADIAALRTFEPVDVPKLAEQLASALANVEVAVGAPDVDSYQKAMSALSNLIREQKDLPALWVLVKRCREHTKLVARYRHLAYFMGVGLLYMTAVAKYPVSHKDGLNADEQALFFDGSEKGDRYFDDFAAQLAAAIWKRAGRPPKVPVPQNQGPDIQPDDMYTAMAKSEGALQVYSDRLRLTLTPLVEAAALRGAVEEAWDKHKKQVDAIRIPIDAGNAGVTTIRVGQTIGNFFVLWWDDKNSTVYLQVNGFEQVIFETGQTRLAEIYRDHAFYGVVAENTQHLLELIPFIFDILGYLPDLVSGGLTGLVKSIAFNLAFDKSMQALGIDPMKAQLFILGVSLLIHGTRPKEANGSSAHADIEARKTTDPVPTPAKEAHGSGFHGTEETTASPGTSHADEDAHAATNPNAGAKTALTPANDNRAIAADARSTPPAPYSDITRRRVEQIQQEVQAEANRFAHDATAAAERDVALAAGAEHQTLIGDRATAQTGATNDNTIVASRRDPAAPPRPRQRGVTHSPTFVSKQKINAGASYQFGDGSTAIQQKLNKSVRGGHHVYMYQDAEGRLLYVGKSGGVLDHHDWVQRLNNSHLHTDWIADAHSVVVYYDLEEKEMWALEEVLIGRDPTGQGRSFHALYNKEPGQYTKLFGEHGLDANASAAMKKSHARFEFSLR